MKNFVEKNYNWLIYVNLFFLLLFPYQQSILSKINGLFWLFYYLFFVATLFVLHFNDIKKNIGKTKYILAVLFILAIVILLRNGDIKYHHFGSPFYSLIILPIVAILIHTKKWIRPALNLMIGFGLFHVFFTFLFLMMPNFYSAHIIPLFPDFYNELTYQFEHHQAAGFTWHYSTNASILLLTIIALNAKLIMTKKSSKKKYFLIFLLIITCVALLLTGKRAHVLFLCVAECVLYILLNKHNLKRAFLKLFAFGCCLGVVVLVLAFAFPALAQPFVRLFTGLADGSLFDTRRPMIELAIELISKKPIFGFGWGNYKYFYHNQIVNREREYMDAHNIYLQMLSEIGIVGTIFILALMIIVFVVAIKQLNNNKEDNGAVGAFILMHCYTLMEGLVGNSIYDVQQTLPYMLLMTMMLAISVYNDRETVSFVPKATKKVLSISVACYNLGNMIETNIKSFCESPVADKIELIITDDGSKDNTPEIVEKYVKKYPNTIKFIKKKNEGPGSTVNSGIKHATGKYFRMVDGDDWVETKNLAEYVALLESVDVDMVVSDYEIYNNSTKQIIKTEKCNLPQNTVLNFNDVYLSLPNQMHAIAYKTSILKNNVVLDNCFYTDVEYVLLPVQQAKTLVYFNKPIYVYRVAQANQSVSPASMIKNLNQHEKVLVRLLTVLEKNKKTYQDGNCFYITNRLAEMANINLLTLLMLETNEENKKRIKNFFAYLKAKDADVYKMFSKSKKAMILKYSNFALYKFAANKVKNKVKL